MIFLQVIFTLQVVAASGSYCCKWLLQMAFQKMSYFCCKWLLQMTAANGFAANDRNLGGPQKPGCCK